MVTLEICTAAYLSLIYSPPYAQPRWLWVFLLLLLFWYFFFFCPNKYALSGQIYTVELGFVYPVLFVSAATESQSV